MTTSGDVLTLGSGDEWEDWLETNHETAPDAWLRIAKSRSTVAGITIGAALDGALCFGWIDGQRRSNDADSFLQRYSPRRSTSSWSRINVERFEALAAAGRVRPAGFAAVDAAKADGRWDAAYASQRTAEAPAELTEAMAAVPKAQAVFNALNRSERYLTILPVLKARSTARRAVIVAQIVEDLAARTVPPGD